MNPALKNIAIGVVATIFVILAIVGFSTLVGGDSHEGHDHAVETVERTAPSADAPADKDDVFLMLVRKEMPELHNVPDSELVAGGRKTCETIDTVGLEFFLTEMSKSDVSQRLTSTMVAASLVVYCPELTPPDWDEEEVGV